MENNESFQYTYSADQRQEVENIRKKYLPKEDKMEVLRRLHASAGKKAQAWALTMGIIGALILGTGMSLIMTEFGALLAAFALPVGVVAGLVGMVLIGLAYPVYNRVLNRERQRIAPQILQLSEELLK